MCPGITHKNYGHLIFGTIFLLCFLLRPATGITLAISKYTAAAQRGVAPGAGTDGLSISEEERRRILEEEQKQLDKLKACCSALIHY